MTIVATLLALSCGGSGSEDTGLPGWDVRFSHVLSTGSEFHLMAERFRDLMLARTDGRFRVVIYPSGQRIVASPNPGGKSSKVLQDRTICVS